MNCDIGKLMNISKMNKLTGDGYIIPSITRAKRSSLSSFQILLYKLAHQRAKTNHKLQREHIKFQDTKRLQLQCQMNSRRYKILRDENLYSREHRVTNNNNNKCQYPPCHSECHISTVHVWEHWFLQPHSRGLKGSTN